jgi:hypothetical protein
MPNRIPITKNGHEEIPTFRIKAAGRLNQLTPDGSNWEIRVHMMADLSAMMPGQGLGEEIIGEVIIRSFNGGIAPLSPMAHEAAKTTAQLVEKVMRALADQERSRVEIVKDLPPDLKMRN